MRRFIAVLPFLACAVCALAQNTKIDSKRMDAIHEATVARLRTQIDVWFDRGDYPRLTQCLRYLATAEPGDYEAQTDLGWMLENMERYDEALAVYMRYRKAFPNQPDAAFPEAYFYFTHRAYAKVPPLLEPTLEAHPHPDSFRILAHAYDRLGLLADSKRTWEALIAWHPNDLAAKANLEKVVKKINGQSHTAR